MWVGTVHMTWYTVIGRVSTHLWCVIRGFFDKGCLSTIRDPARVGIATVRGMRKEIALSESRPAPAHNPTGCPATL